MITFYESYGGSPRRKSQTNQKLGRFNKRWR